MSTNTWRGLGAVAVTLALSACAGEGHAVVDDAQLPTFAKRRATLLVEGCSLDAGQTSTLEGAATRSLVSDVVVVCAKLRESGVVAPVDDAARDALASTLAAVKKRGYRAFVGVTFGTDLVDFPDPYPPEVTIARLADEGFRARAAANIAALAAGGDGIDLFFMDLPREVRTTFPLLAGLVADELHARGPASLEIVAPPSAVDLEGAYDLGALSGAAARFRLMTLDFSCCGAPPGPSIDTGWAVDVARAARDASRGRGVDVAYPLYGTDWSELGSRPISYADAHVLAEAHGEPVDRSVAGELTFTFEDESHHHHETWCPDRVSTVRALAAWSAMPSDVGVVFYGLGAEDPRLFTALAEHAR